MALAGPITQREYDKFVADSAGDTCVRVALSGFVPSTYDTVTVTYPDAVTEVYTFTLAAVPQAVITVTYLAADKEQLSTVVRS